MSDFLGRLIARTSGAAGGVKPLVRPGYGTLPVSLPPAEEAEAEPVIEEAAVITAAPTAKPIAKLESAPEVNRRTNKPEGAEPVRPGIRTIESTLPAIRPPVGIKVSDEPEPGTEALAPLSERVRSAPLPAPVAKGRPVAKTGTREPETVVKTSRAHSPVVTPTLAKPPAPVAPSVVSRKPETDVPVAAATGISERTGGIVDIKRDTVIVSASQNRGQPAKTEAVVRPAVRMDVSRPAIALSRAAEQLATRERATLPPEIKVTIGRIEVRAAQPSPPAPVRAPVKREPAVSLDNYLKRREEGSR